MAVVPNQTYKQSPANVAHSLRCSLLAFHQNVAYALHVDKVLAEPETNVNNLPFKFIVF